MKGPKPMLSRGEPARPENSPRKSALAYRLDTYSGFRERMLARLSSQAIPDGANAGERPLAALRTRDLDDPVIALVDAWAAVCDVLTFYQERAANEGYLVTATEMRSVEALARQVGYTPTPAVSAQAYLAFTVDDASATAGEVVIPRNARVMSVPVDGGKPQRFEVDEELLALPDWNAATLALKWDETPRPLPMHATGADFVGLAVPVSVADPVLLSAKDNPALREVAIVARTERQSAEGSTRVTFATPLGVTLPSPVVVRFLERARLFEYDTRPWSSLDSAEQFAYLDGKPVTAVVAVAYADDAFAVVTACTDGAIRVWTGDDFSSVIEVRSSASGDPGPPDSIRSIGVSPDAAWVVWCDGADETWAVEVSPDPSQRRVDGITGPVDSIRVLQSGSTYKLLALRRDDGLLQRTVPIVAGPPLGTAISASPEVLALGDSPLDEAIAAKILYRLDLGEATIERQYRSEGATADRVGRSGDFDLPASFRPWKRASLSGGWLLVQVARDRLVFFAPNQADVNASPERWYPAQVIAGSISAFDHQELADASTARWDQRPPDDETIGDAHVIVGTADGSLFSVVLGRRVRRDVFGDAVREDGRLRERMETRTTRLSVGVPVTAVRVAPDRPLAFVGRADGSLETWKLNAPGFPGPPAERLDRFLAHPIIERIPDWPAREGQAPNQLALSQRHDSIRPDSNVLIMHPEHGPSIASVKRAEPQVVERFGRRREVTVLTLAEEVVLTDKRRIEIAAVEAELALVPDRILNPPELGGAELTLRTMLSSLETGRRVVVEGLATQHYDETPVGPVAVGERVAEVGIVREVRPNPDAQTTKLELVANLAYRYDPRSVVVRGNVAIASHGETINEVLGSGDASRDNQTFTLKSPPLSFVATSDADASGPAPQLEIRVDGMTWERIESLSQAGPKDRVYELRIDSEGGAQVRFGDGETGAFLPSGLENVSAVYRTGSGPDGAVPAGTITILQATPLGTTAVTNPFPTGGASRAETLADAVSRAPMELAGVERLVSVADYARFARAAPGVAKAVAQTFTLPDERLVHVTVVGQGGVALGEAARATLRTQMEQRSAPGRRVQVDEAIWVDVEVAVRVWADTPTYRWESVEAAALDAVKRVFSLPAVGFGRGLAASDVLAAAQRVPGVLGVELLVFRTTEGTQTSGDNQAGMLEVVPRLQPAPAEVSWVRGGGEVSRTAEIHPAELLRLREELSGVAESAGAASDVSERSAANPLIVEWKAREDEGGQA